MTLTLDVWSDIACPWCYVGKRRLEGALKSYTKKTNEEVSLRWRSFELDSSAPTEYPGDLRYAQRLARKYGRSETAAQEMIDSMDETAQKEGLVFDFESIRAGNTFDAHRLLHFAHERGLQDALKERLFSAYFCEGKLMSDTDTLVRCAQDVGLDAGEVRTILASDDYSKAVREDQATAGQIGVRGVPFFVVAERFGLSGAQPAERILEVLLEASQDQAIKDHGESDHGEGAVCSPEAPC
ncbi:MAG: putative DsbA family dithiol-disulfide isomerase [Polyangiales bacterium]|jgi:predicted DsbA family dithiol-disulfide isomerase